MNTDLLKQEVLTLDVSRVPPEEIGPILHRLNALRDLEKHLRSVLTEQLLDRVLADGDLTIDGVRWYAGTPKTYEVGDVPALLAAILDACGGDIDEFFLVVSRCLSAGWFKVSEIRAAIGEAQFGKLVRTLRKPKLLDGKPVKQLLCATPFNGGRR